MASSSSEVLMCMKDYLVLMHMYIYYYVLFTLYIYICIVCIYNIMTKAAEGGERVLGVSIGED